jgi:HSP20 family protein
MAVPTKREATTLPELFDRLADWRWPLRRPFMDAVLEDAQMPPVDMFKEDGKLVVKVALPGAKPEEIEATVEDDVVRIRREYKEEKEEKQKDYYYKEQRSGSFSRELRLPERVEASTAEAELKDGELTIRFVPEGPSPSSSRIAIKS